MKNIHLLPTDKSSRLYYHCLSKTLMLWHLKSGIRKSPSFSPQNIYITNDEEIKDGEYGICLNLVREGFKSHQAVFKMDAEQRQAMNELGGQKKAEVLKVILTDNPDLIKDGVQTIDDEFLEWFVKNPSCEFVEINTLVHEHHFGFDKHRNTYKIITPKEKPKKETLEEASSKYGISTYPSIKLEDYTPEMKLMYAQITTAFENGSKWQQQQNKNLYSEQNVTEYAYYFESCYAQRPMQTPLKPSEWFNQNKKK